MEFDEIYGFMSPKKRSDKTLDRQYGTVIAEPANQYKISDIEIGEGSFSKVYLATNTVSGATMVAKVVYKNELLNTQLYEIIMNEAKILTSLRHKNIITIHHTEEDAHTITFFMDYYPGGDLGDFMETHEYLSECMAYNIISQLVDAVQYLHDHNIIHRDIKLENLLYDNETNMHVVLADFGFATIRAKDDPLLEDFPGSPAYAAPELMRGTPYTGYASDIWAIGVCLYVLVTGEFPFWSDNRQLMREKILKDSPRIHRHLSPDCVELIFSLLKKYPKERPDISEIKESAWFRRWKYFFETQTCDE